MYGPRSRNGALGVARHPHAKKRLPWFMGWKKTKDAGGFPVKNLHSCEHLTARRARTDYDCVARRDSLSERSSGKICGALARSEFLAVGKSVTVSDITTVLRPLFFAA